VVSPMFYTGLIKFRNPVSFHLQSKSPPPWAPTFTIDHYSRRKSCYI
jgi:hypothetical protein